MTKCLPLLLDHHDLPQAELHAARLDGALVSVAGSFLPVDLRASPALRARSLSTRVPPGHVVERMAAAWVHGASAARPHRLQLCVDSAHRVRVRPRPDTEVREVVLAPDEVLRAGPLEVTSLVRTALDLLRWAPRLDGPLRQTVTTLLLASCEPPTRWRARLHDTPHLPHKLRALRRLGELEVRMRGAPLSRR